MEVALVTEALKELGYFGIYLWLWLGMLGIPIPNEIIVTTIGYLATTKFLEIDKAFLVGYFGIVTSLTTSYLIGKLIGGRLYIYLQKKKRSHRSLKKSVLLMNKFHVFSLCISYFIPGLRNFVPFMYGMMKLPYLRFALFSYTTAFVWFTLFFSIGLFTGVNENYSIYVSLSAITLILSISLMIRIKNSRKRRAAERIL